MPCQRQKARQRELSEWKDLSSGKDGEVAQGVVWVHGSGWEISHAPSLGSLTMK